jgi:hypothetical protein
LEGQQSRKKPRLSEARSQPSALSLRDVQRLAGNRTVCRLLAVDIQRDPAAAVNYTPQNAQHAYNGDFRNHHTPHGLPFDQPNREATAIANHNARATGAVNTTVDMTADDCQREIRRYLLDLDAMQSGDLVNQDRVTFKTRGEYRFVATNWNGGNPVVYQNDRGYALVRMQWIAAGGYYQIYHLDGME